MARNAQQELARYNGLTPQDFAAAVGISVDAVYQLIADRWFDWTKDEAGRRVPECMDTSSKKSKTKRYSIHKNAISRYFEEHAVVSAA